MFNDKPVIANTKASFIEPNSEEGDSILSEIENAPSTDISTGEASAKVRKLGFSMEFAPVDFSAWLSSERSDEEIDNFIASFERKDDDGSVNYQINKVHISEYRAEKLSKE
jgi:hypothetical protein